MADVMQLIRGGFFDSINQDRLYSASDMTMPYKRIVSDGIFPDKNGTASQDFIVSFVEGMLVSVAPGNALLGGRWAESLEALDITVAGNSSAYVRIDSIILRADASRNVRAIGIVYRQGEAAASPTAPTLESTADVVELRIANIYIPSGAASLSSASISDQRGTDDCPWVAGVIPPTQAQIGEAVDEYLDEHPGIFVVDSEFSDSSTNAVQNKVVSAAVGQLTEDVADVNGRLDEQGEDILELQNGGYVADQQQIGAKINAWLNDHPEATTTVQDGAISEAKLASALKPKTMNTYVTPEMYGAVGDGTTDDTSALQTMFDALENGTEIVFKKTYLFDRVTVKTDGIRISGGVLDGIIVLDADNLTFNHCTFKKELEIQWSRGTTISECIFSGDVGVSVPALKTVDTHENPNSYGDPWFHSVGRLTVTSCTFDVGTSPVQVYYDTTNQYGWMRSNDWIYANNISRGVKSTTAQHDFYIQGIDGIRIEGNTFFTADNATDYPCPTLQIDRCDWLQVIGNNFFPATQEFIKLTDSKNAIVSNNHFTWQRYTNGVINSHPAIDISCTVDGQSLIITNNTAYQITGNFVSLTKTGNLIIWGDISGNSCYFRDRTGGATSGNNYVAYSNESFPRVNVHDNAVFGNLYNSDGDESHNVGKTETNVTLASTNCTLGASTFCTYDDESVMFSAEITPSEEISAYTALVTGFPVPKSGYYYMTIADTTGAVFPAFIDRNGLKLRLKSGTRALFVSGFYKR